MDGTQRQRILRDLEALDAEEQEISAHRTELHRQIDQLYLRGGASSSLLYRLEDQEAAVSAQRRHLHELIDVFRAQVGLPSKREELAAKTRASAA